MGLRFKGLAAPGLILALAALVAACAPAPVQAKPRPAVWVVRDADSEMTLFGSVHVLPPGLDWRPEALDAALAEADDLWFELPVDPGTEAQAAALALRHGMMPPGQALADTLDPESLARLQRLAQRHDLPMATLAQLKPWFAEVLVAAGVLAAQGADISHGVERQISALAPVAVERRALESAEQQIALFSAAPLDEQAASLAETLRQLEEDPEAFDRLIAAWMAGDQAALEAETLTPLRQAAPALYERMVTARNRDWVAQLHARLEGSGRTVVVVGAGHLMGEDGLPHRLRALGYEVEGP